MPCGMRLDWPWGRSRGRGDDLREVWGPRALPRLGLCIIMASESVSIGGQVVQSAPTGEGCAEGASANGTEARPQSDEEETP
jgi:hypothetical protein